MNIILNPGHGIPDPGATKNGLLERDITLTICWLLGGILSHAGHDVDIQRENDQGIALAAIGPQAVKAKGDLFISVHTDSSVKPEAKGSSAFIHPSDTRSKAIAERVSISLAEKMGFVNRGVKTANYQVLRDTYRYMPAILVEVGFISNPAEAQAISSLTGAWKIANGIANGVLAIYPGSR